METTHKLNEWKLGDLIYGILIPAFAALLIVGIAMLSTPALIGLKYPLLEAVVIVGVPMLIGLIWNQWAGGASGFLMGSLYALFYADQLYAAQGTADISLLSNLVSAMLIGYIAGALSKRSDNYRRMLYAGVIAAVTSSIFLLITGLFSPILSEITAGGIALVFLPRILAGVLVPLVATAFLKHKIK